MNTTPTEESYNPNVLIAYHANCLDGFTSAWIAHTHFKSRGDSPDLIPMAYTDVSNTELYCELEKKTYRELVVVDFSLKIDFLKALEVNFPDLNTMIIDHHKTAFEMYAPEMIVGKTSWLSIKIHGANIHLNNDESGASLTYMIFVSRSGVFPHLITYVKDYDLWRFDLGDETRYANKYLMGQDKTIDNWDRIAAYLECSTCRKEMLAQGESLQKLHNQRVEEIAMEAESITLGEVPGLSVECPRDLTSDVGHALANSCGTFGAMYTIDAEKDVVTWSLRSNGELDVSAIAKQYGGGGHKNAAGFMTSGSAAPRILNEEGD